jgi:hypothetical protein
LITCGCLASESNRKVVPDFMNPAITKVGAQLRAAWALIDYEYRREKNHDIKSDKVQAGCNS